MSTEQNTEQNTSPTEGPEPVVLDASGVIVQGGKENPRAMVEEPSKVMRIGTMIKQLLDEVRRAPLDEAGRERLAEIHERSLKELETGLSPELVEELQRISLPFTEATVPTESELLIAQAQLVGWLEGLFQGIQTAIVAQQMELQFQQARRAHEVKEIAASPEGRPDAAEPPPSPGTGTGTGQYL
ncbi:bacterial proteasome activator family protein [Micrococcales bacterium 31B]|nr:bacterial proteasome activator family protein [Micrococcales bacterium 31B]